ncbi:MAG: ABC transporter permease subunit [Pirellulaceae bacterium]|nr:ABC transporter permease subunit [Pirellulaceae bacterium]
MNRGSYWSLIRRMYVLENPVLQRELLVNLRALRAFVLLFFYQALLATLVYFAWPQDTRLDLTANPASARNLVDLFFIGQYVLASLMAPSFAAGAISGEKERMTYELLLSSPLRPGAIVAGKLIASLTHLAVLIFSSLPIVMLCLPLGGVSFYEVLAAYLGLLVSVITFGMISIACSSYFHRTAAALVVSYLLILPLALGGVLMWRWLSNLGGFRLLLTITVLPGVGGAICIALFANTCVRLLYPPDVGSEGKEVVDLEQEAREAVGLVIQRDQFPDKLFAPAKRDFLLPDGANPVYDKEMRNEIFSQGTLMLRVVIQVSMVLAIPLMAGCLYIRPQYAPWYVSYVLLFNMLVGPVFSAGTVTSERERQTLDLLLTTPITPWQILWGKLIAGLRVSSVLTTFLLWPVLLACLMISSYWTNIPAVGGYLAIVLLSCLTTAVIALFCSVLFQKTSISLMTAYLVIVVLFCAPLAARFFAEGFFPDHEATPYVVRAGLTSPFAATFAIPLDVEIAAETARQPVVGDLPQLAGFGIFTAGLNLALLSTMIWLFNVRWRVSQ